MGVGESPGIPCRYDSELGNSVQSKKVKENTLVLCLPSEYQLILQPGSTINCPVTLNQSFTVSSSVKILRLSIAKFLSPLKVDKDGGGFLHRRREVLKFCVLGLEICQGQALCRPGTQEF